MLYKLRLSHMKCLTRQHNSMHGGCWVLLAQISPSGPYTVRAYSWATAYLAIMTFDMVYIKHIVTNLKLSTWGLVLYNNSIALALAPGFWAVTGEFRDTTGADIR